MTIADTIQQIENFANKLPDRVDITGDTVLGVATNVVVRPGGHLTIRTRRHNLGTLVVLPGGKLTVQPGVEIVFSDAPTDPTIDPYGWGNGMVVCGSIEAVGTYKQPYRRWSDAVPGNWNPEDLRLLPDSRRLTENEKGKLYVPKWEICPAGESPQYPHPGSPNGKHQPYVANLTRDIVFRSANPAGNRSHIAFVNAELVSVANCEFRSTGRTRINPDFTLKDRGRYPVHFHRCWKPFTFSGNTVWCELDPEDCEFPWGIVLHDSHWGYVMRNVVHNWHGAGIILTAGNETGNLIEGNFLHGIHGEQNPRFSGDYTKVPALDASGIWSRGTFSTFRDNIACGIHCEFGGLIQGAGYQFVAFPAESMCKVRVPISLGANMEDLTQTRDANYKTHEPPSDWFVDNEAYGCGTGASWWEYTGKHIAKGMRHWNLTHDGEGVYLYPHSKITLVDHVVDGATRAVRSGDYRVDSLEVINPTWTNVNNGIDNSTDVRAITITGGEIQASGHGVHMDTIAKPGEPSTWPVGFRAVRIVGTKFTGTGKIATRRVRQDANNSNFMGSDTLDLYDVTDAEGNVYTGRVYAAEQAGDWVIPLALQAKTQWAIPVGVTNAAAFANLGKCMSNELLPANAVTHPKFGSPVVLQTVEPPPPPPNQPPVVDAGPDQTIQWPQASTLLHGTVSDDSGQFDVIWFDTGGASIHTPHEVETQVSFGGPGTYNFRLEASDGTLGAFDTMTVTVLPPETPPPVEHIQVPKAELQGVIDKLQGWLV